MSLQTTLKEAAFEQKPAVCLPFRSTRTFAETAASMRRAFEDLRAAEEALERHLTDIRAHIDATRPEARSPARPEARSEGRSLTRPRAA